MSDSQEFDNPFPTADTNTTVTQNATPPGPYATTPEPQPDVTDADGTVVAQDYRIALAAHNYQIPLSHAVPAGGVLADPTRAS